MEQNQNFNKKQRGKGIVKVSDLFKKYNDTLRAPQGSVVNAFVEAVFEVIGVRIEKEQCSYTVSSKTIMLRAPGMIKTEIKLRKKMILSCMAEKLGAKNVPKEIL